MVLQACKYSPDAGATPPDCLLVRAPTGRARPGVAAAAPAPSAMAPMALLPLFYDSALGRETAEVERNPAHAYLMAPPVMPVMKRSRKKL